MKNEHAIMIGKYLSEVVRMGSFSAIPKFFRSGPTISTGPHPSPTGPMTDKQRADLVAKTNRNLASLRSGKGKGYPEGSHMLSRDAGTRGYMPSKPSNTNPVDHMSPVERLLRKLGADR